MAAIPQLPDYYGILQVSWNADTEAIKSSWKRLALARHPDKNPAKNAVADFQLLQEAYSTLVDPSTRQAYDAKHRAFTSTGAQYSTSHSSRKSPDKNEEQKSMQELQSRLGRCENDIRDHELRLMEARTNLKRLHTELASLKNEVRSLEQEKASGQTIWSYLSSFLPGGESRLAQQRQELDRLYREKFAIQRIKESEKNRRLAEIQTYEILTESYRRQAMSIEREIRQKKAKDMEDYQELARRMADHTKRKYRTQAQYRTQDPPKPTACSHKGWWVRVEGRFRCNCCMKETRRFAFKCPGCEKIACASCRDALKRKVL